MLEAIKYKSGNLEILDQLLLPHKTYYQPIRSVEEGHEAVRSMKVRGAPALSIVAALSLSADISHRDFTTKQDLLAFVEKSCKYLCTARPTAVNLKRVAEIIIKLSSEYALDERETVLSMKQKLLERSENLLTSDVRVNKSIGEHGGLHILEHALNKPVSILTHCNTGSLATAGYGTALGVIRYLHEGGNLKQVYCTETRPYNQGARLTAYELVHDNIPATLICDSMVAAAMKSKQISAVVVGADRVTSTGDTANKIGTYQIAVCAKYHNIPFYVACPKSTFDFNLVSGDEIPIEERPAAEMTSINSVNIAAPGIQCWNPAFDVTPAELITGGIITEIGVFAPKELSANMKALTSYELLD